MKTKVIRRPMEGYELEAVECLSRVRYAPASWDKRFARDMQGASTITEKEAAQVWRLVKKYRRQVTSQFKAILLVIADELAAPDLRKSPALERDRTRYEEAMRAKK